MSDTDQIEQELPPVEQTEIKEPTDAKEAIRQARAMVPATGAIDLAQQVTFAQSMMKARYSVPKHLQNNIGDCLAVVSLATRAGLDPYMVALMTYIQNERLNLMSQLYHALLQGSPLLKGDIDVAYEGEGGDRVCIVTGYLRSDPDKVRTYRSPPLKDRHPGYVLKKRRDDGATAKKYLTYAEGEQLRAEGKISGDDELFCQGSPLWSKKPDLQQFYDTSRDWTRMFAPRATLGIPSGDEVAEYGPDFARNVTPQDSGFVKRLANGTVSKDEGFQAGFAESELEQIAPGKAAVTIQEAPSKARERRPSLRKGKPARTPVRTAIKPAKPAKAAKPVVTHSVKQELERGRAERIGRKAVAEELAEPVGLPRNLAQYTLHLMTWLAAADDPDQIMERWKNERAMRNRSNITQEERLPLEARVKAKIEVLSKA